MFLFTTAQFRAAYLEECFAAQKELSAIEFAQALAQKNIPVSLMTAMMVAGDYEALNEVPTEKKELVVA